MTSPSPFEAPAKPEESDLWRKPVCWGLKAVSLVLFALAILLPAARFLFTFLAWGFDVVWVMQLAYDSACWVMGTAVPASGLWVAANAIGYPETHSMPVLDHNELRGIYASNDLQNQPAGDPGDYMKLSDRDLADVHSAIDVTAKRYPELMAAIKIRVESVGDSDD